MKLNASPRSYIGVGMNRSARGEMETALSSREDSMKYYIDLTYYSYVIS